MNLTLQNMLVQMNRASVRIAFFAVAVAVSTFILVAQAAGTTLTVGPS